MPRSYERVYSVVRQIPRGRVATYGQVARLAGLGGAARQVGYALNAMPKGLELPWHRVINAQGGISPRSEPNAVKKQRLLLEDEGVVFSRGGRTSLRGFQWKWRPSVKAVPRPEDGPPPPRAGGRVSRRFRRDSRSRIS